MKKYVKPIMDCEAFSTSEYIAACWKINCNVPSGYGYIDNNGNSKYDSEDTLLTPSGWGKPETVGGCDTWHKGVEGVPDDGPTANAMWHANGSWLESSSDYSVYYWRDGNGAYDVHFSKVSDAEWETNPNAS